MLRNKDFIRVTGFLGSGKSFLTHLFDGHRNIFSPPTGPDCILDNTSHYFLSRGWMEKRELDPFQAFSIKSFYPEHGRFATLSERSTSFLSFDFDTFAILPVAFDSCRVEAHLNKELHTLGKEDLTPHNLANIFCRNILLGMSTSLKVEDGLKYYVSYGVSHRIDDFMCNCFLRNFPGSKSIYVDRNIVHALIGDFIGHYLRYGHVFSNIYESVAEDKLYRLLETSLVGNYRDTQIISKYLSRYYAKRHPDTFTIVDFAGITENTESCMRYLARWLEIPFDPVLLKCTCSGKEFFTEKGSMSQKSKTTLFAEHMQKSTDISRVVEKKVLSLIPAVKGIAKTREILLNLYSKAKSLTGEGVAVYGAGNVGTALLRMLLQDDITVKYVLDAYIPEDTLIFNTPFLITAPGNHKISRDEKCSTPVLIALADVKEYGAIADSLTSLGWNRHIFPDELPLIVDADFEFDKL